MAQRRADERMAGITAAHRFRLGEQRPGWLAKSKAFSSVMRQERNLEIIKKKSDARRAASEKENAAAPDARRRAGRSVDDDDRRGDPTYTRPP